MPPLPEQRRIAAILDQADTLRAKRRAALAQLNEMAQAIFVEMFGDDKQERVKLCELCLRVTDGTHQPPTWAARGLPFLFVSNVTSGEINFDTEKFISETTYSELTRRCPIDIGDILYSTVGSYGHSAMVRTGRKFAFQRHLAHLKPNKAIVEPAFLNEMMKSSMVRSQADRAVRGMAQKTLNLADLKAFEVVRPSVDQQAIFLAKIESIRTAQEFMSNCRTQLEVLFASLQHRAFRGEL